MLQEYMYTHKQFIRIVIVTLCAQYQSKGEKNTGTTVLYTILNPALSTVLSNIKWKKITHHCMNLWMYIHYTKRHQILWVIISAHVGEQLTFYALQLSHLIFFSCRLLLHLLSILEKCCCHFPMSCVMKWEQVFKLAITLGDKCLGCRYNNLLRSTEIPTHSHIN